MTKGRELWKVKTFRTKAKECQTAGLLFPPSTAMAAPLLLSSPNHSPLELNILRCDSLLLFTWDRFESSPQQSVVLCFLHSSWPVNSSLPFCRHQKSVSLYPPISLTQSESIHQIVEIPQINHIEEEKTSKAHLRLTQRFPQLNLIIRFICTTNGNYYPGHHYIR